MQVALRQEAEIARVPNELGRLNVAWVQLSDFTYGFWWTLPLTVVATVLAMSGHLLV
ncbi:MAG: hypothetical protein IPG93_24395 [Burkholderiales bacterium]|nr:hypothetical protein [Burkholderiales bacterium]